jgi:hypothetical protein
LEFQTNRYPTFWSGLKQQKQGLGNMALSASIAFLAISIIRQEKELKTVQESAGRLKQQNEGLKKRLDGVRSVLLQSEVDEKTDTEVVNLLRGLLDVNGEAPPDLPIETGILLSASLIPLCRVDACHTSNCGIGRKRQSYWKLGFCGPKRAKLR